MASERAKILGQLLAEFLIIVVGILLALQVDQWRATRQAADMERAQLHALRTDLLENHTRLDSVMVDQARVVQASREVVWIFGGVEPIPTPDSVAKILGPVYSWWRLEPVTGAYDAMVSSGDVSRIRNRELQRALASLDGDLAAGFEDHRESMALLDVQHEIMSHYGLDLGSDQLREILGISRSRANAAAQSLFSNPQFANVSYHRWRLEGNRLRYYGDIKQALSAILELVTEELGREAK